MTSGNETRFSTQLRWITGHPSGHVLDETNLGSRGLEINALLMALTCTKPDVTRDF